MSNVYIEEGYKNRRDYLKTLSEELDVPFEVVMSISGMLGPEEDFDGLISSLEDYVEERM